MTAHLETPASLFGRLKLGREELCQRLLTTLILDGPYPRWNTRSRASVPGTAFLRDIFALSFGTEWPGDHFWFVDEFELAARTEEEKGAYPDYALLWEDRVWIVELKTERGSHRPAQIPYYFELARHHHPGVPIDFTYLTGPGSKSGAATNPWERFAHLGWSDVVALLGRHWPDPTPADRSAIVDGLVVTIEGMDEPASHWRARAARLYEVPVPSPARADPLATAMTLAAATAEDGEQRALDVRFGSLDALHQMRMEVRDALAGTPASDLRRHVLPWVWRWQSGGRPLTEAGGAVGYELRLSRYQKPRY
jgi:hypothetical protein